MIFPFGSNTVTFSSYRADWVVTYGVTGVLHEPLADVVSSVFLPCHSLPSCEMISCPP